MNRKQTLSALLAAAALLAVCTACGKPNPPEVTTASPEVTTSQSATETTAATTDSTVQAAAEVPAVVSAVQYTKQAVDIFSDGGSVDFTHSLDIPKIDSKAVGAAGLNAKILADQQTKLDALQKGTEGKELYTVAYDSAACDGLLCIRVSEYTGWQYSEGGSADRFYYYDAAGDRELTLDEYLGHFSIQKDALTKGFAWSGECASLLGGWDTLTHLYADSVFGDPISGEPEKGRFYYAETQYETPCELIGVEVTDDVIRPYFSYQLYTVGTVSCDLERESGKPLRPYYGCELDPADAAEGEALRIEVKDGKVTAFTLPSGAKLHTLMLSSGSIYLTYEKDGAPSLQNGTLYVNGKEINGGFSAGLLETNLCDMYRYISGYLPLEELHTVELAD